MNANSSWPARAVHQIRVHSRSFAVRTSPCPMQSFVRRVGRRKDGCSGRIPDQSAGGGTNQFLGMKMKIVLASLLTLVVWPSLAQTQLIVNGGFESNTVAPWQVVADFGFADRVIDPAHAHSGANYLSMGNAGNANQSVYQVVT